MVLARQLTIRIDDDHSVFGDGDGLGTLTHHKLSVLLSAGSPSLLSESLWEDFEMLFS